MSFKYEGFVGLGKESPRHHWRFLNRRIDKKSLYYESLRGPNMPSAVERFPLRQVFKSANLSVNRPCARQLIPHPRWRDGRLEAATHGF
jgi:hypothetical protein